MVKDKSNSGKRKLLLFALFCIVVCAEAQTTIEVMVDQPEKFEINVTESLVTFTDNSIIFGENIILSGGEEPFIYTWLKNEEVAGTSSTLEFNTYVSTDNYTLQITDANNCLAIIVMPNDFDAPYAIEDEYDDSGITIYPVPASRLITINPGQLTETLDIAFFDSNGVMILQKKISGESHIDINFPSGIYFIRIENADRKLVKQKKIIVL